MPIIATDGSSLGTPMPDGTHKAEGHGGWAAYIQFEDDHPIAPGFSQELIGTVARNILILVSGHDRTPGIRDFSILKRK